MSIGQRIAFAFRAFFSLLFHGTLATDIVRAASRERDSAQQQSAAVVSTSPQPAARQAAEARAPVDQPAQGTPADGAIQLLALLQRDARLVDFLMEDISGYADAQVGAAVREVHGSSRRSLAQYVALEAVLDGAEDQPVTLPAIDPAQVKVVGRSAGQPPIRGTLRHRGWRADRIALPPLPPSGARQVVAPAEVELS
jgi:hypothetical protein